MLPVLHLYLHLSHCCRCVLITSKTSPRASSSAWKLSTPLGKIIMKSCQQPTKYKLNDQRTFCGVCFLGRIFEKKAFAAKVQYVFLWQFTLGASCTICTISWKSELAFFGWEDFAFRWAFDFGQLVTTHNDWRSNDMSSDAYNPNDIVNAEKDHHVNRHYWWEKLRIRL